MIRTFLRVTAVALVVSLALLGPVLLGVSGVPRPVGDGAGSAGVPLGVSPRAGGSVCLASPGETGRTIDMVLAAPPERTEGPAAVAGTASAGTGQGVVLAVDEAVERTAVGPYAADSVDVVPTEVGVDGWLWVGWADHPLAAWGEWRSPGGPGEPRASAVSRCIAADEPEWIVLGLRTDGGNEALLEIVNPYVADATFAVVLRTEAETLAPIALRNVSVPAGQRVTIRVNDHVAEEAALAVIVTVGTGRLAVEGLQLATAGVGGVEGMSSVPALTRPALTWTLPWVVTGPEVDGAVWLLNPEPREVIVEALIHTPEGAGPSELFESIVLPAGAFVRLDAADLAPEGLRVFGLTLQSETTGIYVAAGARFFADAAALTGLVRFVGSADADTEWLDAGSSAPGRETVLHVLNLADDAADLRIALTTVALQPDDAGDGSAGDGDGDGGDGDGGDGAEGGDGAGGGAGSSVSLVLEPGLLAPGAVARIVLPLDGSSAWSAIVTGGDALVVARTVTGSALLEPVAIDALPSRAWQAPLVGLPGLQFDGWAARLGTSGELRRAPRVGTRLVDRMPGPRLSAS